MLSTVNIDPAHYSVYHCDGMVPRLKALQRREQELSDLMARASEGGGGVLIGNLTYRADYENTVAEEKVLRRAAAEKNCDLNPPPPPAAPTPDRIPGRYRPVAPVRRSSRVIEHALTPRIASAGPRWYRQIRVRRTRIMEA